uniref:asparagine synthetase B family protein n=1 Tax=uncultured Halomonas sp. TaxID=173971 RepID=UPI00262FD9BF|nr:asparagine synthase-related protein [uncultured Halomonas sp.]
MSAIAGLIHLNGDSLDRDTLFRMQSLLTPYGRDAQHSWHRGCAGLTRTLLRITPEDSLDQQPLWHHGQQMAMVFDGRLDNRDELVTKLAIAPSRAAQMADSDIAYHACANWDTEAPKHLLGDYAIACWQPKRQRLWLARDVLGTRPLFWYHSNNLFAFATMPKALFSIPGLTKELCEESLHDSLCLIPMTGAKSFYRDVFRVEPGQIVELDRGQRSCHHYFRFDPNREVRLKSDDDYVEAFMEHLNRATKRRLRSCGPIASQLSSGLDSSTITATAARLLSSQGKNLLAYTAAPRLGYDGPVPPGWHADETIGAKALSSRFNNIEHIILRRDKESTPLDELQEIVEELDRAPLNACNMVWTRAIYKDAAERGVKVLLSGTMGNISISHDGMSYLPWLFANGKWLTLASIHRQMKRQNPNLTWRRMVRLCLMPLLPNIVWRYHERHRGRISSLFDYSSVNPEFSQKMNSKARANRAGLDLNLQPSWQSRKERIMRIFFSDSGEYSAHTNLSGIEERDPTADRDLIEFCLSVPESQYIGDGKARWLIRRSMKGILPDEILNAKTRGLQAPDWHENTEKFVPQLTREMQKLKNHDSAKNYLNLQEMDKILKNWNYDKEKMSNTKEMIRYRGLLLRGIAVGKFIRYAEEGNE